jgi:CubicO group peptidase (beta-lactamase class C family)
MKPYLVATLLALPLAAGNVPAGNPETAGMSAERLQRIHQAIQRHIDAGEISGAVTLVARRGHIVHFEAHGLMDLESKKPMAKDAIFRLASMSKPITSVAVMMLVEDGSIRLTDPVSKYIPEFKNMRVAIPAPGGLPAITTVPASREITIRDLLTHTSGLMSSGIAQAEATRLASRNPDDTLATYIPRLGRVPLDFQPGAEWAYSGGAGPEVLSRIVEIVSGQTYDAYLRTRLFEPLGMKDTFFYPPDDRRPRIPTLYLKNGLKKDPNQDGRSSKVYFSGAAGLMASAEDYLQFAQMLLNGGVLNGKRILGPRTVQLMASNQVGDMFNGKLGRPAHGMGFGFLMAVIQDSVAAGLRVTNGSFGWDGVYGTQMWIDPKEQMVTIVMIQEQVVQVQRDFENAVMQAIVD